MPSGPRPDIPEVDKDGTIKWEGYLNKKRAVVPAVRNRYVILRGTKFIYYASHEDPSNNRVPLGIHEVVDWEEWDGAISFSQPILHGFKIICTDRTEIYLGAPNRQDYETWLQVLTGVLNAESSAATEIKKQWRKEKKRRKEEARVKKQKEDEALRLEEEQRLIEEREREEKLKRDQNTEERRQKFELAQDEKKKKKAEEMRNAKKKGKTRRKSQALKKQTSARDKEDASKSSHKASSSTGSVASDTSSPAPAVTAAPAPSPAPLPPPPPSDAGLPPSNPMRNALMAQIRNN